MKTRSLNPIKFPKFEVTEEERLPLLKSDPDSLEKNIKDFLGTQSKTYRKSFEQDPTLFQNYSTIYVPKQFLVPDVILKRIALQDSLIAAILQVRGAQISQFGRPLKNRFSNGYRICIKPQFERTLSTEQRNDILVKIEKATKTMFTCGDVEGVEPEKQMTFSQYLRLIVQDGLLFGRFATEFVYKKNLAGEKFFSYFRPTDAGTIYFATPSNQEAAKELREHARKLLADINKTAKRQIDYDRFINGEYKFIQVINGKPQQAFFGDELVVHNLFPSTNVDLLGYPSTPIDRAISDVMTHINITTYNKMYFQSGRASKGMLVVQSSVIDNDTLNDLRHHFNASINNAQNAWRMPVIGINPDDNVEWKPIDNSSRDMEYQYLYDTNIRIILSEFQMSPEEIPGYGYLSRGTTSQALSESNNAYQLEAARDSGIRPLLLEIQDFINHRILPVLAPDIAEICYLSLEGLDKDAPEKEVSRLQNESQVYMSPNEIYSAVERPMFPKTLGGDFPLNPSITRIIENYVPFGVIKEELMGEEGASQKPEYQFIQNNYFFQWLQWMNQLQMQQQQMEMQQQQMQQQQAMAGQGGGGQEGGGGGEQQGQQGIPSSEINFSTVEDALKSISLQKSEEEKKASRLLLQQQNIIVKSVIDEWQEETEKAIKEFNANIDKVKKGK